MSEEMITVPRQVLVKLAENNKAILERLERLSAKLKLKGREGFFSLPALP